MKILLSLIVLLVLPGCGGGNNSSGNDALTAAKLVGGTWNISYDIGTTTHQDRFEICPICIGLLPTPNTNDYSFNIMTTDISGLGIPWFVKYTSSNDTWTIQGSSAEYVFQTDGTNFLTGACLYETQTDGAKSPCVPLTGVKTTDRSH